jgi:hypothetical protein
MNARLIRLLPFVSLLSANLLADSLDSWHWRNPDPTGSELLGVAYGGGIFVAVGSDIVTSTNGLDWTSNPIRRAEPLFDVAYGEGVFVAVGRTNLIGGPVLGTILTSTNGGLDGQAGNDERQPATPSASDGSLLRKGRD